MRYFGISTGGRGAAIAALIVVCVMGPVGCTVPRDIPLASLAGGTSGVVTPSGTYNLTVSAAADGLTRSVGLVLVVQ